MPAYSVIVETYDTFSTSKEAANFSNSYLQLKELMILRNTPALCLKKRHWCSIL